MRCGGCGAKIGAPILSRVLDSLSSVQQQQRASSGSGNSSTGPLLALRDDAAVLEPPPQGHVTIHTVDFLRSFVTDPWVFGRIAAIHALSDCYAMGEWEGGLLYWEYTAVLCSAADYSRLFCSHPSAPPSHLPSHLLLSGATPIAALAIVVLQYAAERKVGLCQAALGQREGPVLCIQPPPASNHCFRAGCRVLLQVWPLPAAGVQLT